MSIRENNLVVNIYDSLTNCLVDSINYNDFINDERLVFVPMSPSSFKIWTLISDKLAEKQDVRISHGYKPGMGL